MKTLPMFFDLLVRQQSGSVSCAGQFQPNGGQPDFARPPPRTPHGSYRYVQASWRNQEIEKNTHLIVLPPLLASRAGMQLTCAAAKNVRNTLAPYSP